MIYPTSIRMYIQHYRCMMRGKWELFRYVRNKPAVFFIPVHIPHSQLPVSVLILHPREIPRYKLWKAREKRMVPSTWFHDPMVWLRQQSAISSHVWKFRIFSPKLEQTLDFLAPHGDRIYKRKERKRGRAAGSKTRQHGKHQPNERN